RKPLGAALHELRELGRDGRARLLERRRRWIHADHPRRRLLAAYALEDELRDRAGAAAQVHDHLPARTDHPLQHPAIDVGEERMPGERCERKAIFVRRWVQGGHSLCIPSGPKWTSRLWLM